MPLTASTNYKNALTSTIKEEWIFELRNNTYTDGSVNTQYIRLATALVGSGATQYHSLITSLPSIRESIDLKESSSKVGNISINCVNGQLSNHSNATLAEEIYGGTRKYINRDVVVKSRVGGEENIIYTGRLKSVKLQNQDVVSIEISARTPIDFLKIPEYTSLAGNFFPTFYGEGTPITSTVLSPQFIQYSPAKCFPVTVDTLNNGRYNCLAHKAVTDGRLHYPLKDSFSSTGFPLFVPLDDIQNTSTNDYEGTVDSNKNVLFTALDLHRSYKFRPIQDISVAATKTIVGDPPTTDPSPNNTANFYDNDDSTFGTWKVTMDILNAPVDQSITDTETLTYSINNIGKEEHEIQECKLHIKWGVSDYSETAGTTLNANLNIKPTYGGLSNTVTIATETSDRTPAYQSAIDLLSTGTFSNANGQIPDTLDIIFEALGSVPADDSASPGTLQFNVYDFYLEITTKITDTDNLANSNAVTSIKKLYTGADGLHKSWSSGAVTTVAEMHRDLMYRFAGITTSSVFQSDGTTANLLAEALDSSETGVDVDDGSVFAVNDTIRIDSEEMLITSISSNTLTVTRGQNGTSAATHSDNASITRVPENFTTLNTARSGWTVFYYLHKQKELLKVLEQTQKEGGFIFRFKANDGSPQYIYLVDSPATNHTISKSDIINTNISLTAFDNLITKRVIKHQRNPINDELLFEVECTDTTNNPRTDYNVQSDENIATEELEILNGNIVNTQEGKTITSTNMGSGNKNDGYANYYNAIEGNPKLLIDTEIINPGSSGGSSYFYLMEVGDICAFDHTDMIVEPFGQSFNGKKFIVTGLTRSPGSLKVSLREI